MADVSQPAMVKVRIGHASSVPHARWCRPIGWSPRNRVDGADWYDDGAWLDDDGETAGIVLFGGEDSAEGDTVTVSLDDLRVVSSGDCRVIGPVEVEWIEADVE